MITVNALKISRRVKSQEKFNMNIETGQDPGSSTDVRTGFSWVDEGEDKETIVAIALTDQDRVRNNVDDAAT